MEINIYAKNSCTDANKVLRMVRGEIFSETGGERQATRMCSELYAPSILLNFLLDIEATRNGTADRRSSKKACSEIIERAVRSVRDNGGIVRTSYRRESEKQLSEESAKTVHELSLVLARLSETHAEKAIDAHAASVRARLLRGAGNAIVPQVAAEVIGAYMMRAPAAA